MEAAWIGVIGTIIGVIIGNYISINSNEKIARKNFELEKLKIQREYDLERLNFLLKPIIFKYMESDQLRSVCINNGAELFGKGLYNEFFDDVKEIIDNNTKLISIDIQDRFLAANHQDNKIEFSEEFHISSLRNYDISRGKLVDELLDFSFDDNREFIGMITKEANDIEIRYK